jgi:hypothetical protein
MYVFRVEDALGTGPYSYTKEENYKFTSWLNRFHGEKPDPFAEQLEFPNYYVCGFADMKKYRSWFLKQCRTKMVSQSDFKLVKYLVKKKHVNCGVSQLVFNPYYANKICEYNPLTLERVKNDKN